MRIIFLLPLLVAAGCNSTLSSSADEQLRKQDEAARASAQRSAEEVMRDARIDAIEARLARLEREFEETGRSLDAGRIDDLEQRLAAVSAAEKARDEAAAENDDLSVADRNSGRPERGSRESEAGRSKPERSEKTDKSGKAASAKK